MKVFFSGLFDDRYGAPGKFSVYRCTKCGFGRTIPVLRRSQIGKFYKTYYPLGSISSRSVKKSATVMPRFLAWVLGVDNTAHRYVGSGADVLDIGSGSGSSLLEIRKMGSRAYGIEPDPNAQRIAKKLKLNVYKGFVMDNPFPGKKFDYITGSQVIEHEPYPLRFLIAAKKKLKKGGRIILSFPNFSSIFRRFFGKNWLNWHVPFHINFFTEDSLKKLAKRSGLKVTSVRTVTPNIWTVFQIRKMFITSHYGDRNLLWSDKPSGLILRLFNIMLFILITPFNRIIDLCGAGDSLLVVLQE